MKKVRCRYRNGKFESMEPGKKISGTIPNKLRAAVDLADGAVYLVTFNKGGLAVGAVPTEIPVVAELPPPPPAPAPSAPVSFGQHQAALPSHAATGQRRSATATRSGPSGPAPQVRGQVNPYNFVPFFRTDDAELGEHEPLGHDRWHADTYSGALTLELTTVSPLLPVELTGVQGQLQQFTVRRDASGHPIVPGSSVKGMLRSMYEQVTGSRVGVFEGNVPLTRRVDADDALKLSMARVRERTEDSAVIEIQGDLVPSERVADRLVHTISVPHDMLSRYTCGQEVFALLKLAHHVGPTYQYWRAEKIADVGAECPQLPSGPGHYALVRGYLHKTGKSFKTKRTEKHDERLFVVDLIAGQANLDAEKCVVLGKKDIRAWEAKIDSFNPRARLKGDYITNREAWRRLTVGQTMFAREREHPKDGREWHLYPGMITREQYFDSPRRLLGDSAPAAWRAEMTAADRVFGWVPASGSTDQGHRGQLRVGAVASSAGNTTTRSLRTRLKLQPLSAPKPQQVRFYQRHADGRPLHGIPKADGYGERSDTPTRLAGAKVYPTHQVPEEYWAAGERLPGSWDAATHPRVQGRHLDYLAATGTTDATGWAIDDWVPINQTFAVRVSFDNLTRKELGALLWITQLPEDCYHRLGRGKPLGFGAIRTTVKWDASTIRTHDDVVSRYSSVTSPDATDAKDRAAPLTEEFNSWLAATQPEVRQAVLTAARGTDQPIHYPRTTPGPQAESYHWFVNNEKGPKHALQPLGSFCPALPELPH